MFTSHIRPGGTLVGHWQFVFDLLYSLHECVSITVQTSHREWHICLSLHPFCFIYFPRGRPSLLKWPLSLFTVCRLAFVSFSLFCLSCMLLFALRCCMCAGWQRRERKTGLLACSLRTQTHTRLQNAFGVLGVSWESSQFQRTLGVFHPNAARLCDVQSVERERQRRDKKAGEVETEKVKERHRNRRRIEELQDRKEQRGDTGEQILQSAKLFLLGVTERSQSNRRT